MFNVGRARQGAVESLHGALGITHQFVPKNSTREKNGQTLLEIIQNSAPMICPLPIQSAGPRNCAGQFHRPGPRRLATDCAVTVTLAAAVTRTVKESRATE